MKIELITEGILKGWKVLIIDFGTHKSYGYYDGTWTDEQIIEKRFTVYPTSSTPINRIIL